MNSSVVNYLANLRIFVRRIHATKNTKFLKLLNADKFDAAISVFLWNL